MNGRFRGNTCMKWNRDTPPTASETATPATIDGRSATDPPLHHIRAGSAYGRTLLNAATRNTRARVSRGADASAATPTTRYNAAESRPDHASNAVADMFIARYYVAHNAQGDAM